MAIKLTKGEFPSGHGPDDFTCFGPPATKDGEFDNCFLADLGCFTQDGKDSNKYYAAHVCQSKKNSKFYTYFEWGRTGSKGDIQFTECSSKEEAQSVFAKQMHEKNDKRGQWVTLAGRKVLQAKPGKDCYLVRPQAKRTVGLPDAQKLIHDESGSIGKKVLVAADDKKKIVKASTSKWDAPTLKLMKDMNVGAIDFARAEIQGGAIPTQGAIDEVRDILIAAKKRIKKIGNDLNDQVKDNDLRQMSYHVYSRIPKVKRVKADESTWLLTAANIDQWDLEVDAFENALNAIDIGADSGKDDYDPFEGMPLEMVYVDFSTKEGKFICDWMPKSTANKHGHIYGSMRIHNIWAIRHKEMLPRFIKCVERIGKESLGKVETPLFQPKDRSDLQDEEKKQFSSANSGLLFHGTRSVNVPGILRTGLRLPKELVGVAITGAMFGPLLYMADDWKKSAGYTSASGGYWSKGSGGVKGRQAFMFVCDCALGKPYVAPYSQGFTSAPKGHHCIFGKANVSGVANNEWVLPSTEQHNLRYLVEFSY